MTSTLHAQAALGQLAYTVASFSAHDSENGADLSPNERAVVLGLVEDLSANLDRLENSLQDNLGMPVPISKSRNFVK